MPRRLFPALSLPLLFLLVACTTVVEGEPEERSSIDAPRPAATFAFVPYTPTPTPSPTPSPTPTATPPPTPSPTAAPTRTATPTPAPTQRPVQVARGSALIIGDGVAVRSAPSTKEGRVVASLGNLAQVQILGAVKGERWVVGDQDWPMVPHSWTDTWYQVDGGYVYSAYVFIPTANEGSPFDRSAERSVQVDIRTQTLRAFVGERVVFTAAVTTGKNGFETPPGRYTVGAWGRVANETMTSGQAGINDEAEAYHVKNVLFTQYFDALGDALHLNYWQPESLFGNTRTSHGCVGLFLHDAQWLWLFTQGGVRLVIQ